MTEKSTCHITLSEEIEAISRRQDQLIHNMENRLVGITKNLDEFKKFGPYPPDIRPWVKKILNEYYNKPNNLDETP